MLSWAFSLKKKQYRWATFFWIMLILALISIPSYLVPEVSWLSILGVDKFVHAFLFGILSILLMLSFMKSDENDKLTSVAIITLTVCLLYSSLTEILQASLFKHRSADILDHVANSIGAISGVYFINFRRK